MPSNIHAMNKTQHIITHIHCQLTLGVRYIVCYLHERKGEKKNKTYFERSSFHMCAVV